MQLTVSELVAAEKTIPAPLRWAKSGERYLEVVSTLDVDGVTVQGLQLRILAWRQYPDEAVCIQLLYAWPRAKYRPIWRIEWRPFSGHNNRNKGPPEFRLREIKGSHQHTFRLNWREGEGVLRQGNLPIAVPINPDPTNFASLLAFSGNELRIRNMGTIPAPPWEGVLL
jgi:hypothetical protein